VVNFSPVCDSVAGH